MRLEDLLMLLEGGGLECHKFSVTCIWLSYINVLVRIPCTLV